VRASSDGYTLLEATSANVWNAALYDTLNFDFIRDIAPVASISRTPAVLTVTPSFPAETVPEFISYARANPGKINMASGGIGSLPHVAGELFKFMTGINLVHVPYRGSYKLNAAVNAVLVEDSEVQRRFAQLGTAPVSMTPGEFGKLIADESDKWGKVFRAAGIKAE
jgi:tripartite-type tricarboxylate transporter receptor subunit TctC